MATTLDNNKAAPFAVTINPLLKTDVLVWHLENGYLNLGSKTIDPSTTSNRPGQAGTKELENGVEPEVQTLDEDKSPADPFANCVAIATAATDRMIYAFATRDADKAVCIISPSYAPLGKKAVADGQGIAALTIAKSPTVFYITTVQGAHLIQSWNLDKKIVSKVQGYKTAERSQLAAAMMSTNGNGPAVPYLFFQSEADDASGTFNGVFEASVNSRKLVQIERITRDDIPEGTTPLAACNYQQATFLFFLSSTYYLSVVQRTNGDYNAIRQLKDKDNNSIKADPNSGLSAVCDIENERIVVTYKSSDPDTQEADGACSLYSFYKPICDK